MANMSYCRFENTYNDLNDCYRNLNDGNLSEREARYRSRLTELCDQICCEAREIEEETEEEIEEASVAELQVLVEKFEKKLN
jgi:hypothetical protein